MELITADKPPVLAKPFLDPIVVEDGQGNGRFPNPARTDESNRSEGLDKANDLLNQLVPSETGPRWWGRRFSWYAVFKCKATGLRLRLKLQT